MIHDDSDLDSGPVRAYILARDDAVRHWRELMGPTKVFRARHTAPATIRGQFGLTDTRNTTHGSGMGRSSIKDNSALTVYSYSSVLIFKIGTFIVIIISLAVSVFSLQTLLSQHTKRLSSSFRISVWRNG